MTGKEFQEWLARNSTNCPYVAVKLNLGLDTVRRWKANGTPDKHEEWFEVHDQWATTAPTPPEKNLRQDGYRDVFVGTQTAQELYEQGEEYISAFLGDMVEAPVLPLGLASLRQLIASRAKDVEESLVCLDALRASKKYQASRLDTMQGEATELAVYAAMVAAACSAMLADMDSSVVEGP